MAEESRYPYAGSVGEATLSWKTRTVKNNRPGGQSDHGSYYAILPKQQVRQLGWEPGIKLDTRAREDGILLSRRPNRLNEDGRGDKMSKPPLDQIIQGDVLDVLAKIPSSSVHLAVTSPPYNVGIRYDRYHDEREYAEYRLWLGAVWKDLYRVLVRGGRFALQTAPTSIADFRPIHTDLTNDARAVGFEFRAEIIWYKQNMTAPRTAWGSFRSPAHPHVIPSWEYVNVLHKQDWKLPGNKEDIDITSQEFVEWSDAIWLIPPATSKPGDHPAAFPEELVERILRFFSFRGQTILDPFGGTGTVAAVAKRTGRHYISIDHSPEYARLAEERVAGIRFGSDGRRPRERRSSKKPAERSRNPK
jgi:DNA modification methylase